MNELLPKEQQPPLHKEILRLHGEGFSLLPLSDKQPLVKFEHTYRLPVNVVIDRIIKVGSECYGVRLNGIVVLDIDDPVSAEELLAEIQNRFGRCGVIVRTSRGYHLYYQYRGGGLPVLRSEGLAVDVKTGRNEQVVGPGSVRSDGAKYDLIKGPLSWDSLTAIQGLSAQEAVITQQHPDERPAKRTVDGLVPVGSRHKHLKACGWTMIEHVASYDEIYENLIHERDNACEDPESHDDKEVHDLAKWFWDKRCSNQLYKNGRSAFPIWRDALDLIKGETAPTALYIVLCDAHGHLPGKMFSLCHEGMKKSGLTDLGRGAFRKAVKRLVEVGLLQIAKQHRAGSNKRQYRLSLPSPKAENITPINNAAN